jgi:hypothetical protein
MLDVVLPRFVQVDGVVVDHHGRREQVDLADHHRPRMAGHVDDHDILRRTDSQGHLGGGEVLARPVPAVVVGQSDVALFRQERQKVVRWHPGQRVARVEGQLEGRRPDVSEEDVQVGRVQPGLFRSRLKQVLGMGGHELVDRSRSGNQDGSRRFQPPARPTHLLPGGGNGARVAGQDGCVQPADIDAQLQRIGRHDAEDFTRTQSRFYVAPLRRQVTAAIAADALYRSIAFAQCLAQAGQQQLDGNPRLAKYDRLAPGADERKRCSMRQPQRARPNSLALVDDRRIEHNDVLLAGRRAVAIDDRDGPSQQCLGECLRVADGRRAEDELGPRTVVLAQPQQAADDVGDVAAEYAAVGVRLVDDHVAQLLEQLEPLRVMRQDGGVEHVRVGHHDLSGGPDQRPNGHWRVAVVDTSVDVDVGRRSKLAEGRQLVLAERLGREEVEGAGSRVFG